MLQGHDGEVEDEYPVTEKATAECSKPDSDKRDWKTVSYGMNVCSGLMFPCSEEISQVLTVAHISGVVIVKKRERRK